MAHLNDPDPKNEDSSQKSTFDDRINIRSEEKLPDFRFTPTAPPDIAPDSGGGDE
jgi:hypothetical protein